MKSLMQIMDTSAYIQTHIQAHPLYVKFISHVLFSIYRGYTSVTAMEMIFIMSKIFKNVFHLLSDHFEMTVEAQIRVLPGYTDALTYLCSESSRCQNPAAW